MKSNFSKPFSLLLAIVITTFQCSILQAHEPDYAELYEQAVQSIVIVAPLNTPNYYDGTGIYIGNKQVITNIHVVRDLKTVELKTNRGTTYVGTVIYKDPNYDLVVIELEKEPTDLVAAKFSLTTPKIGEDVFQIGHPAYRFFSFSKGYNMYYLRKAYKEEMAIDFQVSLATFFGSSGAGIFNPQGEVVGMARKMIPEAVMTIAIPSIIICSKIKLINCLYDPKVRS